MKFTLLLFSLSFFILTACSAMIGLAPAKENAVKTANWLVVPVFYATNRAKNYSQYLDYVEQKNDNGLFFGVKNIVVPCPDEIKKENIQRMRWRLIHLKTPVEYEKKPDIPENIKCQIANKELSSHEIVDTFAKYRTDSCSNEAVLFIHGCCVTFKTSMERAAKLTAQMQLPVVVYDWVSPIGFTHYLENETLAEQTYDEFCTFLDNVAKHISPSETTLIGHSMGAIFVDTAMVRRFQRIFAGKLLPRYKEIILAQPDIDARTYLKHDKQIVNQADKIRIFMVLNDSRLRASAIAHGGFERLGRPGKLLGKLCNLDKQDIIDMTVSGIGHNLPVNFIASMHQNGSITNDKYITIEKSPHLFVMKNTANNQLSQ